MDFDYDRDDITSNVSEEVVEKDSSGRPRRAISKLASKVESTDEILNRL